MLPIPISKESAEKRFKFGSDLVISSLSHPDFNGFEEVSSKNKKPFIIKGPGEYEKNNIFTKGYGIIQKYKNLEKNISSYTVLFDNITLALFGPIFSSDTLSNEAFDEFSKADIFFIPIGIGDTFSIKEAVKFINQFNPKIIIPTFYEKDVDLDEFSKALGVEIEKFDKLTIKSKDLIEGKQVRLIDLSMFVSKF